MIELIETPRVEIIKGMPFSEYCALPGLNQSLMKKHCQEYEGCPALFRYHASTPVKKDSDAMRKGRAFHTLILEPLLFVQSYKTLDDATGEPIYAQAHAEAVAAKKTTTIAKYGTLRAYREEGGRGFEQTKAYKEWATTDTREIVDPGYYNDLCGMLDAIKANKDVMEELAGVTPTDCEVTALSGYTIKSGPNEGKSLQLKARLDIISTQDAIIDAKTCRTTNPRKFAWDVQRYGYDFQAAFYRRVLTLAGDKKKRFGFLAQEKEPPYLNCIHWMPEEWISYMWMKVRTTLCEIAENIRLNRWEGPSTGMLEPPASLQKELEAIA